MGAALRTPRGEVRWELAAGRLGYLVARHPEAFADKSQFAMDWYYPVLGGAVRGAAADGRLESAWETFVLPGLGVRCVSGEPRVRRADDLPGTGPNRGR